MTADARYCRSLSGSFEKQLREVYCVRNILGHMEEQRNGNQFSYDIKPIRLLFISQGSDAVLTFCVLRYDSVTGR